MIYSCLDLVTKSTRHCRDTCRRDCGSAHALAKRRVLALAVVEVQCTVVVEEERSAATERTEQHALRSVHVVELAPIGPLEGPRAAVPVQSDEEVLGAIACPLEEL